MKKIVSLVLLTGMLTLMSFSVDTVVKNSQAEETPCQNYAISQIVREINHYGPMSNSEIADSYQFYMDICSEGGMEDAVFL